MPAIHIRDVPEGVLEALKLRARQNERSLQGELRYILSSVVRPTSRTPSAKPLQLRFSEARPEGDWSREEIYSSDGR